MDAFLDLKHGRADGMGKSGEGFVVADMGRLNMNKQEAFPFCAIFKKNHSKITIITAETVRMTCLQPT